MEKAGVGCPGLGCSQMFSAVSSAAGRQHTDIMLLLYWFQMCIIPKYRNMLK